VKLFRELTAEEEAEFRKWARDNYVPFSDIRGIWHPVVQDECRKMNESAEALPGFDETMKELGWGLDVEKGAPDGDTNKD
jgi:hypothetical protein